MKWNPFKRKPRECYFFFVFRSTDDLGGQLTQTRGVIDVVNPGETTLDAVNRIAGRMKDSGDVAQDAILLSLSIHPALLAG